VSRALARGDIDNDGDLDLLITSNGGAVQLLLNEGGNRNNALLVRTIGTAKSNRDGIGARLKLTAGGRTFVDQVTSGSSYLAQHDMRVHFGLGATVRADRLEITWPDGRVEVMEDPLVNHVITVREGQGETRRVPFAR
jgi:enediyne biosynthesis protein E4